MALKKVEDGNPSGVGRQYKSRVAFGETEGGLEIGGQSVGPVSKLRVGDALTRGGVDEGERVIRPTKVAAERQSI